MFNINEGLLETELSTSMMYSKEVTITTDDNKMSLWNDGNASLTELIFVNYSNNDTKRQIEQIIKITPYEKVEICEIKERYNKTNSLI